MVEATKCCEHRAADHKGFPFRKAMPKDLEESACTFPGCPCRRWIPRKGTKLRGKGLK